MKACLVSQTVVGEPCEADFTIRPLGLVLSPRHGGVQGAARSHSAWFFLDAVSFVVKQRELKFYNSLLNLLRETVCGPF